MLLFASDHLGTRKISWTNVNSVAEFVKIKTGPLNGMVAVSYILWLLITSSRFRGKEGYYIYIAPSLQPQGI